jgi:hypothetical protein
MKLKRFKEICTRYTREGGREYYPGDVIRVVSISERDAKILNEQRDDSDDKGHHVRYELETEPVQKEQTEMTRAELFLRAKGLGLSPAKNIKTSELKAMVDFANEHEREGHND